jgi:hypothetical protein
VCTLVAKLSSWHFHFRAAFVALVIFKRLAHEHDRGLRVEAFQLSLGISKIHRDIGKMVTCRTRLKAKFIHMLMKFNLKFSFYRIAHHMDSTIIKLVTK